MCDPAMETGLNLSHLLIFQIFNPDIVVQDWSPADSWVGWGGGGLNDPLAD